MTEKNFEDASEPDDVHIRAFLASFQGSVRVKKSEKISHQGEEWHDGRLDQKNSHCTCDRVKTGQFVTCEVQRWIAPGCCRVVPVSVCYKRAWNDTVYEIFDQIILRNSVV